MLLISIDGLEFTPWLPPDSFRSTSLCYEWKWLATINKSAIFGLHYVVYENREAMLPSAAQTEKSTSLGSQTIIAWELVPKSRILAGVVLFRRSGPSYELSTGPFVDHSEALRKAIQLKRHLIKRYGNLVRTRWIYKGSQPCRSWPKVKHGFYASLKWDRIVYCHHVLEKSTVLNRYSHCTGMMLRFPRSLRGMWYSIEIHDGSYRRQ